MRIHEATPACSPPLAYPFQDLQIPPEFHCFNSKYSIFSHAGCVSAEFLVQFEEDHWDPGRWQDLSTYPGDLNSVILQLAPFVNYQFRVIAINAVGQSQPSRPSPRYKTSGAGEQHHIHSLEIMCVFKHCSLSAFESDTTFHVLKLPFHTKTCFAFC